ACWNLCSQRMLRSLRHFQVAEGAQRPLDDWLEPHRSGVQVQPPAIESRRLQESLGDLSQLPRRIRRMSRKLLRQRVALRRREIEQQFEEALHPGERRA